MSSLLNNLLNDLSGQLSNNLNPVLRGSSGVQVLLDLDFSEPNVQTFSTANATYEWQLQESSGNYIDSVSGVVMHVSGGLQGQTAVGIWDGTSYAGRKAWEVTADTDVARVADASIMDSDNTSVAVRIVFRTFDLNSSVKLWTKKDTTGVNPGILLRHSSGQLLATVSDGTNAVNAIVTLNEWDGAWHYADVVYDTTNNELRLRSDLGSATEDISTIGSLSNSGKFAIGDGAGSDASLAQICYIAAIEGSAAESLDSDDFWSHGLDPTGKLDAINSSTAISVCLSGNLISHYGTSQLPIGFSSDLSGNGLGLAGFHSITNLIDYSEDLSQWTKVNSLVGSAAVSSPDGFESALPVIASADNGYITRGFTTEAGTQYLLSAWVYATDQNGVAGRLIFYNESGGSELASQTFIATDEWQLVTVSSTAVTGQVSSSFRIEIDTSADSFYAWGAQAQAEAEAYTGYVRTIGTTGTSDSVAINIQDSTYQYLDPESGEVWWEGIILDDNDNESKSFFEAVNTRNHDRRYFRDTTGSGGITAMVWDAAGRPAGQPVAGASIVKDTPLEIRYRWDVNGCPTSGLIAEIDRSDTGDFASNGSPPFSIDGTTLTSLRITSQAQPLRGLLRRLRIFDKAMESSI